MLLDFKTPPKSICLLRLSAIGDVTHMLPVIHTIRTHSPETKITWIIGKPEAKLVGDIPNVEFIIFDKTKGWRSFFNLKKHLRERKFDLLLLMQVSLRANIASLFVKSPIKLGFDRTRSRDFHGLFVTHRIPVKAEHVLDSFLSFLGYLGVSDYTCAWDIPNNIEAQKYAESILPGDQNTLVISPCSKHLNRNWSPANYAAVSDYIIEQYGYRVLVVGANTAFEFDFVSQIKACLKYPITDLVGKTSLKELLALLKRSTILVSPDSGPAHMGTCAGIPVIGLYAATNVARARPYLSEKWCVDKYDAACQKFLNKKSSEVDWGYKIRKKNVMDLISVNDVLAKIDVFAGNNNTV